MDGKRFVRVQDENTFARNVEVWVDRLTGVNYLYISEGYSGGLTPLLDAQGRPVVTFLPQNDRV